MKTNMLKHISKKILLLLVLLLFSKAHAQVYTGTIAIENQAQLDALNKPGGALYKKTSINGGLYIIASDVNNLKPLVAITKIKGDFEISSTLLRTFEGLENIEEIGDFRVAHNDSLISFKGLENLRKINSFEIFLNQNLTSLAGLNKLKVITDYLTIDDNDALVSGSDLSIEKVNDFNVKNNSLLIALPEIKCKEIANLIIGSNASLNSLSALKNITTIKEGVFIRGNSSLHTLDGLQNIKAIGDYLDIWGNNSLTTLDALESLHYIGKELHIADNSMLINLKGLEQLIYLQELGIENNSQLVDYCAISELIVSLEKQQKLTDFNVKYNKRNPTIADFKAGKCTELE